MASQPPPVGDYGRAHRAAAPVGSSGRASAGHRRQLPQHIIIRLRQACNAGGRVDSELRCNSCKLLYHGKRGIGCNSSCSHKTLWKMWLGGRK
jgi:hypothetical protein